MPMIADHCIDLPLDFYISCGVSRLHNHGDFIPENVQDGDVVFVKTDEIYNGRFQNLALPRIQNKFILVSGISSYNIGSNGDTSYMKILQDPKLIKWFCTNPPNTYSEKIIPLPIGFEEMERQGGNQMILADLFYTKTKFEEKKSKVLLPHHTFETNPIREKLYKMLSTFDFVDVQNEKLPFRSYMKLLDEYKFVICLEGSGPDVHRNYESLLVGSVPINLKNVIQQVFDYHNLPGVFLTSWDDLSEDVLDEEFDFCAVSDFLRIKYHANIIRSERNEN
jgi:hypothetical protein